MKQLTHRRLVIVANRLPFQLTRQNGRVDMRQSDGGLVSALKGYFERADPNIQFASTLWIGSAEFSEKTWSAVNKRDVESLPYSVHPIFFDKKVYSRFYNGFCNATLWPLFHYFPSFVEFDSDTFDSYMEVNTGFANAINEQLTDNDILWIHDYQLMLVPQQVRKVHPKATIGFFLHIPFPSFELFRLLHQPWKEQIINGLLGADLIGFHTHEYVQHFLKSVQMVKGYDHHFRSIPLPNTVVKAEMFPLGIDFDKFHNASSLPDVAKIKSSIRESFPSKKIIFSVDRLDYTKGINHRLAGFESFLERHSEWREQVVFILVVVPSRQIVSKYNERKKIIEEEIGRINGKYSSLQWQPIIYRYANLNFNELVAMYDAANVGLITPLRDGMNLVAKEYVASKIDGGVLILSELAGAANELSEALLVNPMDKGGLANAIFSALTMPDEAQRETVQVLQNRLKKYTVTDWMKDFLNQLDDVKREQVAQETNYLNAHAIDEMMSCYNSANRRLFLLDYDGTLVPFAKHPSQAIPDHIVRDTLQRMSSDERSDVTIISGRDSDSLQQWFGSLPITLVSEHGAAIKLKNAEWRTYINVDQSWKLNVLPVLELFCQRSPGSFIEEKNHTLAWHYRNVDHELGFIRSRELVDNLHHLIRNASLQIVDGNKVVEIRIAGINKGAIAARIINEYDYDFVMAIGDDKTDEDMFKILDGSSYTIKIGAGHTAAKYHLNSYVEVLNLLRKFADQSQLIAK